MQEGLDGLAAGLSFRAGLQLQEREELAKVRRGWSTKKRPRQAWGQQASSKDANVIRAYADSPSEGLVITVKRILYISRHPSGSPKELT